MARAFTDNPGKGVVREYWNTPLLRHLHQAFGVRYRYLGLPGADLIDVRLWRDMIEEVIAFQTPDKDLHFLKKRPTLHGQGHKALGQLEDFSW